MVMGAGMNKISSGPETPATMWTRNHARGQRRVGLARFRNGYTNTNSVTASPAQPTPCPIPCMAEWGDRVETEQRLKGQRTDHRTDCRRDDRR